MNIQITNFKSKISYNNIFFFCININVKVQSSDENDLKKCKPEMTVSWNLGAGIYKWLAYTELRWFDF